MAASVPAFAQVASGSGAIPRQAQVETQQSLVLKLERQLAELELEYGQLRLRLTEAHPDAVRAAARVTA